MLGLLIAGSVFALTAIISFSLKIKYKGREGKKAAVYMDNARLLIAGEVTGVRSPATERNRSYENDEREGGELEV